MRLFTSTLLADLSAAEVAEHLDGDAAESRCQRLVDWGNLALLEEAGAIAAANDAQRILRSVDEAHATLSA